MAANIKAKVTEVPTSQVAMLADPKSVTKVIIAAGKVGSGKVGSGDVIQINNAQTEAVNKETTPLA